MELTRVGLKKKINFLSLVFDCIVMSCSQHAELLYVMLMYV